MAENFTAGDNEKEHVVKVQSEITRSGSIDNIPYEANIPVKSQHQWIGILRITFGLVWAVAAWLKWQPGFISSFEDTIKQATTGQPPLVQSWIGLWVSLVHINPILFASIVAIIETALAICFIFGIFTNAAAVVGAIYSIIIWSIAEGFGGPYVLGQNTDIGTAFPYMIVCLLLLLVSSGDYLGLDRTLTPKLGNLSFLATGRKQHSTRI